MPALASRPKAAGARSCETEHDGDAACLEAGIAAARSDGERRRVVVAMSGGVDSAVSAALMKHAGHDVIGVTLQLYDNGAATGKRGSCCAGQDVHDARRVAAALAIPHYVLDYERRFEAAVMAPFADSYLAGETPIPCVACNSRIKFRDLLETAAELGAAALATGHYVQRRDGPGGPALLRARDQDRDQSYFLFATTREQLARLRFPLGAFTKPEVRAMARALKLPVAEKPDSQDICFVASGRYGDVIERLRPGSSIPGEIVHVDGRVLGSHQGIARFTVGQRRGLNIAAAEPLFVVGIDPVSRRVVVGPRHSLRIERLMLKEVSWLASEPLPAGAPNAIDVHVRVRSSQPLQPARIWAGSVPGTAHVELDEAEHGVAAGQACVVYADASGEARVLGGGWIAANSCRPGAVGAGGEVGKRPSDAAVTGWNDRGS